MFHKYRILIFSEHPDELMKFYRDVLGLELEKKLLLDFYGGRYGLRLLVRLLFLLLFLGFLMVGHDFSLFLGLKS